MGVVALSDALQLSQPIAALTFMLPIGKQRLHDKKVYYKYKNFIFMFFFGIFMLFAFLCAGGLQAANFQIVCCCPHLNWKLKCLSWPQIKIHYAVLRSAEISYCLCGVPTARILEKSRTMWSETLCGPPVNGGSAVCPALRTLLLTMGMTTTMTMIMLILLQIMLMMTNGWECTDEHDAADDNEEDDDDDVDWAGDKNIDEEGGNKIMRRLLWPWQLSRQAPNKFLPSQLNNSLPCRPQMRCYLCLEEVLHHHSQSGPKRYTT